jgi:uncharacterized membrane protein YvbJ
LITCPNCGNQVRDTQQFCGNCGTDVHAALAAASQAAPAAEESTATPYAYSQPSGYGYDYQPPVQSGGGARIAIIAAAAILILCCVFVCGLTFGFEIIPDFLGIGGNQALPRVSPTPTPSGWLPIIHYFIG